MEQVPLAATQEQQLDKVLAVQTHPPLPPVSFPHQPVVYGSTPSGVDLDGLLILCSAAASQPGPAARHDRSGVATGDLDMPLGQPTPSSAGAWDCRAACLASLVVSGELQLPGKAALNAACTHFKGTQPFSCSADASSTMVVGTSGMAAGSASGQEPGRRGMIKASRGGSDSKTQFSSELLAFGQEVADDALQQIMHAEDRDHAVPFAERMRLMQRIEDRMRHKDPRAFGAAVNKCFQLSVAVAGSRKVARRNGQACCDTAAGSAAAARAVPAAGVGYSRTEVSICYEQIAQLFQSCSIQAAAGQLGLGLTTLKAACRDIGIARWPYREFSSIDNALEQLQKKGSSAKDRLLIPGRMLLLQHARYLLQLHPNMDFELHPAASLVQTLHKQKYKSNIAKKKPGGKGAEGEVST